VRLANSIHLLVAVMVILTLTSVLPASAPAQVSVGISVGFAPPELPVYEQPICPGEGYIWTPGYWAWDPDDEDYYWVPGTWVQAPEVGYLWTPGYWGWGGSGFVFYEGYWGPRVGFYGGIDYGYGYSGRGYEGGRWDGGRFYYNRTVNNINVTEVHNVYNTTVVNNVNVTRVSYNGGNGGVNARATAEEQAAAGQRHMAAVAAQTQHVQAARSNRELRASENHGKPPIAATQRPGALSGGAVVPAREGGKYNPPPSRGANNRTANPGRPENNTNRPENNANRPENNNTNRPNYVHPNELPKANRPDRPPNTGNPKTDQKYQKEQEKMYQKQDQERQKLQQKQEQEHHRLDQQKADDARKQQTEQRHQQQTQQMQQKHEQQQQKMEQRQQPPHQQAPPSHPSEKRPPN
jgi:hypothetical protein